MTMNRLLGLRNGMHRVDVVQLNDSTLPVLGTAYPQHDEMERRLHVQQQWDHHTPSPRAPRLASIDEPLAQRSQTILYYQVGPEVRQQLNAGGPTAAPRQSSHAMDRVGLHRPVLKI